MALQVLVSDPKELERIREREFDITKERIQKMLDAGANVILTTKGIDDMALKYFVEAGAIACRRVPKDDLKRIAKATGAQVCVCMGCVCVHVCMYVRVHVCMHPCVVHVHFSVGFKRAGTMGLFASRFPFYNVS